ncbi:hypothetical protein BO70DRAFT_361536 [Aspergillus heteromorphus CBS 117.55]|uniref:Transcription factor domain-containing protein n=1 Tax=Aspergillus heteromorphus CBS 117.55 TaxID=1448321 RepID=A0A317WB47_9EURO|nr:uncharacterized protein BO70DRAFT_361536 [Aspergillus heteromorphus CBS 117.55]PWY83419.1 hypothetical protein BO70DRAFT_361536 [Aspergillus heteromorphus CBS 117.55]
MPCNNEHTSVSSSLELDSGLTSAKRESCESSDRGSIKFLLNGGTDTFTEEFLLPPRRDRFRSFNYQSKKGLEEAGRSILQYPMGDDQVDYASACLESDPAAGGFFQEHFLDLFNGPFRDTIRVVDSSYGEAPNMTMVVPPVPELFPFAERQTYESEPFAAALYDAIWTRISLIPLGPQVKEQLTAHLDLLLTPEVIRKFVLMYCRYWQPSCAMVHLASMDLNAVPLPLLAAIAFMGAMYSPDPQETHAAKQLLDFVELFIFSSEAYSADIEVASMFSGFGHFDIISNEWELFQNFQAGFIIVIVQYWSGSRPSRNRAMENRFSEVIKVARRLGLHKSRHVSDPEKARQIPEYQWIQTECRIRTINIILLLDCAFSFFQNYPCRLSHMEAEFDFPCAESIFGLRHPYTDLHFQPSRQMTISDAFQKLFETDQKEDQKEEGPLTPESTSSSSMDSLTVLDMFTLIHLLYTFINSHMTLLAPITSVNPAFRPKRFFNSAENSESDIPNDMMMEAIKVALSRWLSHWTTLRNSIPRSEWTSMGFFKNGYNFWLVSQLLITKKHGLDVIMQTEVKCEDKVKKLKILLEDDSD